MAILILSKETQNMHGYYENRKKQVQFNVGPQRRVGARNRGKAEAGVPAAFVFFTLFQSKRSGRPLLFYHRLCNLIMNYTRKKQATKNVDWNFIKDTLMGSSLS